MQGYSLGTQLGILLPYSRKQEYEADHIGLILMAKAGYDPAQALEFWRRMMTKDKKVNMPQFMSTHPNDASRLAELEAFLPEARKYYVPAPEAQSRTARTPPPSPTRGPGPGGRAPAARAQISLSSGDSPFSPCRGAARASTYEKPKTKN